jgi:hypothetical protein
VENQPVKGLAALVKAFLMALIKDVKSLVAADLGVVRLPVRLRAANGAG